MRPSAESTPTSLKAPLLVGLGLAVLAILVWRPLPAGIWHDDGVYLLIAKSLASGEGLTYAGVPGTPPAAKFPPLYPAVLAPFWLLGDDVAAGSGWVAALNILFMASAAAVFCGFLIRRGEWSPGAAAAVTLLAWCSPVLWQLTAIPLSEPLFILTLCLAVAAFARLEPGEARTGVGLFVLAAAAAYLTRTAGVAMLGAGILALLLRRDLRRAGLVAAAGAAVVVPWTLWSGRATASIAAPLRDILGSYGSWLGDQMATSPAAFVASLGDNLLYVGAAVRNTLVPLAPGPVQWAFTAVLAAALAVGLGRAWRTSPLLILFPLGYAALLSVWPYRSARLVAPLIPFLVVTIGAGVREGLRWAGPGHRRWGLLVPIGAAAVLLAGRSVWMMSTGGHLAAFEVRARALVRTVDAVRNHTPSDAVIGAPELWAALHLHTGRSVVPSARFLPLAPDGATAGTPEQQIELWRVADVDYLVFEDGGALHGDALTRLEERCPEGTVGVVATFPEGGFLVRLGGDGTCSGMGAVGAAPPSGR